MAAEQKGIIFNIQHFSVHDGPGIRTVVFLKGCPLRCKWCANPESQNFVPELAWTGERCIGCRSCIDGLSAYACRWEENGLSWDTGHPVDSVRVKRVCPSEALHVFGEEKTVAEVIGVVAKDKVFYAQGEGGLTLGGGEPLSQPAFSLALLEEARKLSIHCAIETASLAPWKTVEAVAGQVDYYLTDIKTMDDSVHRSYTGVSNREILENIRRLRERYPELPMQIRTPVIPGVNDSEKAIAKIASFLNGLNQRHLQWELLKYHRFGVPKYTALRREYEMGSGDLSEEAFQGLRDAAKTAFENTI